LARHPRVLAALAAVLLAAVGDLAFPLTAQAAGSVREVAVPAGADLTALLRDAQPGTTFRLAPGEYDLKPRPFEDPTCGNCPDPARRVNATVGLRLSGKNLRLVGAGRDTTLIRTHAGYGILIEDCDSCAVEGVTVTGGVRDPDQWATDAGIVVRRSTATIRNARIRDNLGDSTVVSSTVVGIMGIAGREGAKITIDDCEILHNSWNGIALYRDSEALIEDSQIDGVERVAGTRMGGGRGIGIEITWNARATLRRNLVRNYWKGIGVFADAQAQIEHNIVEETLAWGISLWDAGFGHPRAVIERNAIFRTGACGVTIATGDSARVTAPAGKLVNNIVAGTCIDPRFDSGEHGRQIPIAVHGAPDSLLVDGNLLWGNRQPQRSVCEYDIPMKDFFAAANPMIEEFHAHPVQRRSSLVTRLRGAMDQPEPGNIFKKDRVE
jgi:hypothetical protein